MYTTMEEAGLVGARDVQAPGTPSSRRRVLLVAGAGGFVVVLVVLMILAMSSATATSTVAVGAAHGVPTSVVMPTQDCCYDTPPCPGVDCGWWNMCCILSQHPFCCRDAPPGNASGMWETCCLDGRYQPVPVW